MRDLAALDFTQQSLCITYLETGNCDLKTWLIHLLHVFYGLEREDPHKFIKEFHVVCSNMRPHGVTEEQLNLKTFPFALKDDIKHWLYILPAGFVTIWAQMKKLFLEKIFPAFHTTKTRKEIYDIMQVND